MGQTLTKAMCAVRACVGQILSQCEGTRVCVADTD